MDNDARRPLALVTGASSGIGLELAKQFAENDFDLILAAEDGELATAARELEGLGAHVDAVQIDLAKPEGVEGSTAMCPAPRARSMRLRSKGRILFTSAIASTMPGSFQASRTPLSRSRSRSPSRCATSSRRPGSAPPR